MSKDDMASWDFYFLAVDGYDFGTEEFQCPVYTEEFQCGASTEF